MNVLLQITSRCEDYSKSGDVPQSGAHQLRRIPRFDMELLLIAKKKITLPESQTTAAALSV